jgi:hypothetical protein
MDRYDFKDEKPMDFDKEKSISPIYLAHNQTDHLSYLSWNFSIFGNEEDEAVLGKNLVCAVCEHPITKVSEKIEIFGRHDYGFTNLGYLILLGCYRSAPGCVGTGRVSHGYSWFRGYSWEIQLCSNCYSQLGWKYMSSQDSFYALVFKMLCEKEPPKD